MVGWRGEAGEGAMEGVVGLDDAVDVGLIGSRSGAFDGGELDGADLGEG